MIITQHIKPSPKRQTRGFTLVELTVALLVGLMISSAALTMFTNQLASFRILKAQNFLIDEAPSIDNTLNRIISRANFFQMYTDFSALTNGEAAVITGSKALVLRFQSTGSVDPTSAAAQTDGYGVITFTPNTGTHTQMNGTVVNTGDLDYYFNDNFSVGGVLGYVASDDDFTEAGIYGVNAEYFFNSHIALNAGYTVSAPSEGDDNKVWSIGLVGRF